MKKKKKKKKAKPHFELTLKQLRKIQGFRQSDLKAFEQASVSKIEGRKDLKISTLIDYLDAIDMDLEIRALSRSKNRIDHEVYVLVSAQQNNNAEERK